MAMRPISGAIATDLASPPFASRPSVPLSGGRRATFHMNRSWASPEGSKFAPRAGPDEIQEGDASPAHPPRILTSRPTGSAVPNRPPPTVPIGTKLQRVENLDKDSWAGVAAVDRADGTSSASPLWTAILLGGDLLALLTFATIGRINHGESISLGGSLETAAPFVVGWCVSATLLGGFKKEAVKGGNIGSAVGVATKCWAFGIPLGLVIRSITRGYVPEKAFITVSLAATAVLLGGWRAALAGLSPADATKSTKPAGNKQGNPFEFLSLLFSLVKRW